jgi:hypothetical protein
VWEETLGVWQATVLDEALDGTANHSILAHQDHTISTKGDADLVHLLGGDIVYCDNEDRLIGLEKSLELIEVSGPIS